MIEIIFLPRVYAEALGVNYDINRYPNLDSLLEKFKTNDKREIAHSTRAFYRMVWGSKGKKPMLKLPSCVDNIALMGSVDEYMATLEEELNFKDILGNTCKGLCVASTADGGIVLWPDNNKENKYDLKGQIALCLGKALGAEESINFFNELV